jgi:hypothetical protein
MTEISNIQMDIIIREGTKAWCITQLCNKIRHDPHSRLCYDCKKIVEAWQ